MLKLFPNMCYPMRPLTLDSTLIVKETRHCLNSCGFYCLTSATLSSLVLKTEYHVGLTSSSFSFYPNRCLHLTSSMSSSPSRHSSSRNSTVLSPRVSASGGNKTSPSRPPNTTDHQQLVPFESPHSGITQDMSSITLAPSISSKPASTTSSVKEGGAVEAGRRIRTPSM